MSDNKEVITTLGFWAGFIVGMFLGLAVFGVAIIGQGFWSQGIEMGRSICKAEFARHSLFLPTEAKP
jgi:hypothetical protein